MHPTSTPVVLWPLTTALLLLGACPDPGGKFDDFAERTPPEMAPPPSDAGSGGCDAPASDLPSPEAISGSYLLVVSTPLDRQRPFVYRLEVTASGDGTMYQITMREQPLSATDRKTPIGPMGAGQTFTVAPSGCFQSASTRFVIPAQANPIIPLQAMADLAFSGTVSSAIREADGVRPVSFWCGEVNGMVTEPLPMRVDGSTFTATRIVDPASLPPVVINCAMEPAVAL